MIEGRLLMDEKAFKVYSFSEIFDIAEIQKLQDLFSVATGVASIITETDGTPITEPSGFSTFCNDVVRKTQKGLENCMHSDAIIGNPKTEGPCVQRCLSGGLMDGGMSIVVEGTHIANWLIGQVLDSDVDLEDLRPYADTIGADPEVYMAALKEVQHMSQEQFENVSNLLYMYVGQLSKYAINNITLSEELDEKNLDEIKLTLKYNEHLEEMNGELEEINATLEKEVIEREKVEEEIIELNKSLEKKVQERTRQLEELTTSLEEEIEYKMKAEETLLREYNFIRALFDSVPGYLFVYDMDGKLIRWNKKHETMTGYSSKELLGMTMADWFDGDDYTNAEAAIEEIFEKGYGEVVANLKRKDGSKTCIRSTGVPLTNDGKTYFTGMGIDITEQKINEQKLMDSEASHKAMIANISDVIGIIDLEGIIRYKSPNITQWFGWEPEALIGEHYTKTAHIDDWRYIKEIFGNLIGKPDCVESLEYQYYCKDGSYKSINMTAINLVNHPYIKGILVNYHDITERKMNEKIITEARAASDAKSTFLANMSHEIRTPLNAIIGTNYLMEKTNLDSIQRDYMKRISLSAGNLLGHVNDVLDFSKIEANKLTIESKVFDLFEVLNDIRTIVSFELYKKQLELRIIIDPSIPQVIKGDGHRLSQILLNLVNNSIKFTEQGTVLITVEKEALNGQNVQLKFIVKDTGIGMTKEQQGSIFNAFSQGDMSTTRKYGGTGLGLTITKNLIELMGGESTLSSQMGIGTEFSFNPIFEWIEADKNKNDYSGLEYLRALVVSGNSDMNTIFTRQLFGFGIAVDCVNEFAEALIRLKDHTSYHIIFISIDLLSKELDTLELQISRLRVAEHIKIILISVSIERRLESLSAKDIVDAMCYYPMGTEQLYEQLQYSLKADSELIAGEPNNHILDNLNILLVEDNEINRELVVTIMEEYGVIMDSAENGLIALDMISKNNYDMVLMDLQMPVLDGYDTTLKIREIETYKHTPIIAMSAHAIKGVEERIRLVGMDDYITKPFNVPEMIKKLSLWAEKIRRCVE